MVVHEPAIKKNYKSNLSLTAYKLNSIALPEKIYKFKRMPSDLSLQDVENGNFKEDTLDAVISIAYDESGSRIWYSVKSAGVVEYSEVVVPGVGKYLRSRDGSYSLSRMNLIDGGYRMNDGPSSSSIAYYPVLDAQGSVRGYATATDGLISYYDYYPFGSVASSSRASSDDKMLWQSKDYDGELGKYYFGARYYDPFLGLWMSPDPAEQFANPYTYGGDPTNYIDPDGRFVLEMAICAGISFLASAGAEAYHQGKNWWKVNRWDWGRIANSTFVGALVGASWGLAGGVAGGALSFGLGVSSLGYTVTLASYANRLLDPDNEDRLGTFTDFFTGGAFFGWIGNTVGLTNSLIGGTTDWYRGYTVYSHGFMDAVSGGGAFAAPALFVHNRNDKAVIAHEMRHVAQMVKTGFRFYYAFDYMYSQGEFDPSYDAKNYYGNEYEIDAYYTAYLFDNGYVDIYGHKQGDWTHEETSRGFVAFWNSNMGWKKENGEWKKMDNFKSLPEEWVWNSSNRHGPNF